MRIHYQAPDAVVTSELFIRPGTPPETFALRDLRNVVIVRVAGVAWWRRRSQCQELRAEYRGTSVALFSSADARVFNQVRRALLRAMENLPLPASWHDQKAA